MATEKEDRIYQSQPTDVTLNGTSVSRLENMIDGSEKRNHLYDVAASIMAAHRKVVTMLSYFRFTATF